LAAYGTADYYLPNLPNVTTNILRCASCEALVREIAPQQIHDHCGVARYTNLANETLYFEWRKGFFAFLHQIVRRYSGKKTLRCLDFGCSYGHFLELLKDQGCSATGIEFIAPLRAHCAAKGLVVFESLDALKEAAPGERFDLIAIIDTLYHVSDPNWLMASLRELLCDDGLLLIRVTSRHGMIWWLRNLFRRTHLPYQVLGDATITYSKKTIDRLLAKHGFTVVERHYWERGKRDELKFTTYSLVTVFLQWITGGLIALAPGLIVLARKVQPKGSGVS
jgi:2-polyprenyl-3-methyl-5-hydroxy-6-metoxy-1,4-benzoquinol methylase